jgi:predicted N-acetyltransferase YhbS
MITIEPVKYIDLQGLKELYEDAFGGNTDFEKMTETFSKIKNDPNQIILAAKTEGKVVGSVLGVICHELIGQCTPFMVLEDVAVLSTFRRKGIAKKLMIQIEEEAKQNDCNMILFVSSSYREGAHKLYESLGYGTDKVNGYRKRLG